MPLLRAKIKDNKQLAKNYYKLTLESKEISENSKPGQFINALINPGTCPMLRRPFAIHRVDKNKETFEILYEIVGMGTKALALKKVGEKLDLIGPLGTGFKIDAKKKSATLVAGGIGIAPLTYLAEELIKQGKDVCVILGEKTDKLASLKEGLVVGGCKLLVTTEDGSAGKKGLATEVLITDPIIYACGPKAMLKAVAKKAKSKKISCQVSLEEKMACGLGACLGCAIMTRKGMKMVCKDGPVFNAEEIIW